MSTHMKIHRHICLELFLLVICDLLIQTRWFLHLQKASLSLYKVLIDGVESCGLLVDYCDVFISCLDSHSDGTHSLQRIYWWTSNAMLIFSKSVLINKQTHLHLGSPRLSKFSANFNFSMNYLFNVHAVKIWLSRNVCRLFWQKYVTHLK